MALNAIACLIRIGLPSNWWITIPKQRFEEYLGLNLDKCSKLDIATRVINRLEWFLALIILNSWTWVFIFKPKATITLQTSHKTTSP